MPLTAATTTAQNVVLNASHGAIVRRTWRKQVVVGSAAATAALFTAPAGSVIRGFTINFDTAITLATAVKVGLGSAADPDGIGLSGTTMTKNTKFKSCIAGDEIETATALILTACDTDGAAEGTMAGTFNVTIEYDAIEDIADAA